MLFSIITAFFFLATNAIACNYQWYGDSECARPPDNNYCITYSCQIYTGPTELFCNDTDGNNQWVYGIANGRYRDYDGAFQEFDMNDQCLQGNLFVQQCLPGYDCKVQEAVCAPSGFFPYSFVQHSCPNGCNQGKCVDNSEPDSAVGITGVFDSNNFPERVWGTATDNNQSGIQKVEIRLKRDSDGMHWNGSIWSTAETWLLAIGTTDWNYGISKNAFVAGTYSVHSRATDNAQTVETTLGYNYFLFQSIVGRSCDYQAYGDSQCDANNQAYCINNSCTQYSGSVSPFCLDTDDQNFFKKGSVSYRYRLSDGQILDGNILDECQYFSSPISSCTAGSNCKIQEGYCKNPLPQNGQTFDFNLFSCPNGCNNGACVVLDQNQQSFVDVNRISSVNDSELLLYIQKWANGQLQPTEAANDSAIQQIIAIWKQND